MTSHDSEGANLQTTRMDGPGYEEVRKMMQSRARKRGRHFRWGGS